MANYATLKASIEAVVKTNGNKEITGANLQTVLLAIVNSLGADYQFAGVATPSTDAGTPDQNVFYIGAAGTYENFGSAYTVLDGYIGVFTYNGSWTRRSVSVARNGLMSVNRGFFIDADHLINNDNNQVKYKSDSSWDCAIIFCAGAYKVKLNGLNSGATYRYYNSADIFTGSDVSANFITTNTTGIVPDGAVVCLLNMQKSSYPSGYGAFYLEKNLKDEADIREASMDINKGFYIDESHLMNSENSQIKYKSNTSWDCAIIYVEGAVRIKLNGVIAGATYRYYNSADIFSGDDVSSNFITTNTTGIVPEGAVVALLNMQKSTYSSGYAAFSVERKYQEAEQGINLLLIGNSAAQDAIAYVPFILQNLGVSRIRIGILMQSDSTLQMHVNNFNNETNAYTFYLFDSGSSWSSSSSKTIQWALDNYTWDIVTLHQGANSSTSVYNGSIQPYLNQIANLISAYVEYPVKFIFYQNQSRPASSNGGANWSDEVITQHYEKTVEFCQTIMSETIFENIVPVGTAIQNARTIPSIKELGDYASDSDNTSGLGYLNYDGIHLQEGLPSQIAAYTFVLSLLDIYGMKQYSINGETTRVTAEWETGKNIPSPHGTPIGSTDTNCLIAQKCAIMAIKNPYEVTDMNYIVNPT